MAAVERATGGLTRAELQTMLLELRMRRASFLRGEQPSSAVQNDDVVALKTEVARLQGMMQMSAAGAANHAAPQSQNLPAANAIDGFKGGDNAIILEGVYTGLSDELEKVKEYILRQL